jgi:ABC-2 type transport system ATP-binding protein
VFVTTHYMDEAERCTRVALMHQGRLLAMDTLPRLRALFRAGAVVELRCPRAAQALAAVAANPQVAESALFGEALHVVLCDPGAAEEVRADLETRGFGPVQLRQVVPSLEDVFIHVIGEAEGRRCA